MLTTIYGELEAELGKRKPSTDELESRRLMLATISAYKALFESPEGTKVYQHLLKASKLFEETFVADNPYLSARNEGMRKIGLMVRRFIETPLEDFMKAYEVIE